MNKFFVLALAAAFVCGAAAGPQVDVGDKLSQAAIFEDDVTEVKNLSQERKVFEDFCKQTRDDVRDYINNKVNQGASFLFKKTGQVILDSADKVNEQQKVAVDSGAELIRQDAKNAGQATSGVFSAIVDGVKNGAQEALDQFKGYFSVENRRGLMFGGCDAVLDELKPKLEDKLEATKEELMATVENEDLKAAIGATTLQNVGCVTTGRISRIANSCLSLKQVPLELLEKIGL